MPGALTLRQAKAAHKARGGSTITDAQVRQLQREIQLDRRAWAVKERDKSRLKAAHTRAEDQKRSRTEQTEQQLGTQLRYDRFGHKSSQFHLGAFFTKASNLANEKPATSNANQSSLADAMSDDENDDLGGLDDESLLSAFRDGSDTLTTAADMEVDGECHSESQTRAIATTAGADIDAHSDWDDFLESGTQIARELNAVQSPSHTRQLPQNQEQRTRTSFDSASSFGLTTQDLETLDPTDAIAPGTHRPNPSMSDGHELMPPPTTSLKKQSRVRRTDNDTKTIMQIEFSSTQLERLVADEIMLTQI